MVNTPSLVSIIIVSYNAKEYLISCIEACLQSKYQPIEIIVVDNGSSDGTIAIIHGKYANNPHIILIPLEKNYGPAYARNRGIEYAKGKYFAFLDNDTKPDVNWLIPLIEVMEQDKSIAACQCKLLLMQEPNRIDYVGDYLSQYGFLVQEVQGGELDVGQAENMKEILSAKSAAMVARADVVREIGGFDEDYFIYVEETDLGWRMWLKGYRVVYIPSSIVYHAFGTTSKFYPDFANYNVRFHGCKNYILTLYKNFGRWYIWRVLPLHIGLWLAIACWLMVKGQGRDSYLILKGIWWNIMHLPSSRKKRKLIQKSRKVTDTELIPHILRKRPLKYFYQKLATPHKVGHADSWYRPK
ncbi:MAG: glycosyltransferase family 2 protein [bacterium]|nr:glycosyltransferase family 2 protein [bacterium]